MHLDFVSSLHQEAENICPLENLTCFSAKGFLLGQRQYNEVRRSNSYCPFWIQQKSLYYSDPKLKGIINIQSTMKRIDVKSGLPGWNEGFCRAHAASHHCSCFGLRANQACTGRQIFYVFLSHTVFA